MRKSKKAVVSEYNMSVLVTRQHKSFGRIVCKVLLNVPFCTNIDGMSVESVAIVDTFFTHEEIGSMKAC